MKKLFVLASLTLFSVQGLAKNASETLEDRLIKAGCWNARTKLYSEIKNEEVKQVKQVKSKSGKTTVELALMKDGSLSFVPTKSTTGRCKVDKFSLVQPGLFVDKQISIDDLTVMGNKVFMIGSDRRPYFMHTDGQIYELLNSSGKSYSTVKEIKGSSDSKSITLKFNQGQDVKLTDDTINNRQKRKVELSGEMTVVLTLLFTLLL